MRALLLAIFRLLHGESMSFSSFCDAELMKTRGSCNLFVVVSRVFGPDGKKATTFGSAFASIFPEACACYDCRWGQCVERIAEQLRFERIRSAPVPYDGPRGGSSLAEGVRHAQVFSVRLSRLWKQITYLYCYGTRHINS